MDEFEDIDYDYDLYVSEQEARYEAMREEALQDATNGFHEWVKSIKKDTIVIGGE